jgi:hypothetical protein
MATKAPAAIRSIAATIVTLKGRGKARDIRESAYIRIAPLSFVESAGRAETVENLKLALGTAPTQDEIDAAKAEWKIGRIAQRLPSGEFPNDKQDQGGRLEHARNIVLHYAMPASGATPPKLKAGQTGRRSEAQHKAVRAADVAWIALLADAGVGEGQTSASKAKAKQERGTKATTTRAGVPSDKVDLSKAPKPTHDALVKAPAPVTADDAMAFLISQSSTLAAYGQKYAGVIPTDAGKALQAFRSAMLDAGNAFELAKAERDARKAEAGK